MKRHENNNKRRCKKRDEEKEEGKKLKKKNKFKITTKKMSYETIKCKYNLNTLHSIKCSIIRIYHILVHQLNVSFLYLFFDSCVGHKRRPSWPTKVGRAGQVGMHKSVTQRYNLNGRW